MGLYLSIDTLILQKFIISISLAEEMALPYVATQQVIVAGIETEQSLVTANRELIVRFEKNIQATLARIWGEDEPVTVEA